MNEKKGKIVDEKGRLFGRINVIDLIVLVLIVAVAAVVALNIGDYDSSAVSDVLSQDYDIATRPGAHCAPRMHEALGTTELGAVRFSFSWFNTEEEVDAAIAAMREISQ